MKICQWIVLSFSIVSFAGCGGETGEGSSNGSGQAGAPQTLSDPEDVVAALEPLANDLRKGGNGLIAVADFRGKEVGDDDLVHLKELKGLSSVLLNDTKVTDEGLKTLGTIATLRNLDLRGCKVTNKGMSHLAGLMNLAALKLTGKGSVCTVDDDGLVDIGQLTSLRALAVDSLWISGDGLKKLAPLKSLEELYIGGDDNLMDDDSMGVIVELFPNLKKLRISKSTVTGDGLAKLVKLENLEELDVSECSQIYDDALQHLAEMTNLKRLNLWRVGITDMGVSHLAKLTKMEWLNLDNTQLADAGLEHLKGMGNLKFLHLGSTFITDTGLEHLEGLASLEDLRVTRTAVTEEGAAGLKKEIGDQLKIQLIYIEGE